MKTERNGAFETNSSSTHAISINAMRIEQDFKKEVLGTCISEHGDTIENPPTNPYNKQTGYITFNELQCRMSTTIWSVLGKLRYVLALYAQCASGSALWPLARVDKLLAFKPFKDLVAGLRRSFESHGLKLSGIRFSECSTKDSIELLDHEWYLGMFNCANTPVSWRDSGSRVSRDRIVKLLGDGKLVYTGLDHEVVDGLVYALKRGRSVREVFSGYDPVKVITDMNTGIAYWRNG